MRVANAAVRVNYSERETFIRNKIPALRRLD